MKHTPAPWKVRFFDTTEPEKGFFVEAANNNKPELGYGIEILGEDFGQHNGYLLEQRLADAKLIAAAPELLAACVEFVRKCDEGLARSTKSYAQMQEAIKKATQ